MKNLCDTCKNKDCSKTLTMPDEEGEKELEITVEICSNYKK
jgi:hypothetical protein